MVELYNMAPVVRVAPRKFIINFSPFAYNKRFVDIQSLDREDGK